MLTSCQSHHTKCFFGHVGETVLRQRKTSNETEAIRKSSKRFKTKPDNNVTVHINFNAVASRLVRLFPDRVVRLRALAGDTVLCSWARHLTLTVPLFTQEYKWVPANCWGNLTNCGEVTCNGLASRPGGVEILVAASCYRNRDKLRQL